MALLFSFEGIDGSGKSTQARLLVERLRQQGMNPLAVREPGGTALSEKVRNWLLDPHREVSPRAEMLLFAAARAQLVDEAIRPALADGRPVVCDRFFDSTTAYQGGGRAIADMDWLADFHRFTTGGLTPLRTYIMDVPLATARSRRSEPDDRMEAAGDQFFNRVAQMYRQIAASDAQRVILLDGTRPPEELHHAIWESVCDASREENHSLHTN